MSGKKSFLAFPGLGFSYCRIPKNANTFLRNVIATQFRDGAAVNARGVVPNVNTDAWWDAHGAGIDPGFGFLDFDAVAAHRPALLNIVVIRDPLERLVSCYADKVLGRKGAFAPFEAIGLGGEMGFDAFADRVAAIPDERIDIHLRSQTGIIGGLPDHRFHVRRLEAIDRWLPDLLERMAAGTGRRIDPARITPPLVTSRRGTGVAPGVATRRRIEARYAQDFELYEARRRGALSA